MFLNFVFTEGRWNEKLFKSNIPYKNEMLKIIHFHVNILFEPNDTFDSKIESDCNFHSTLTPKSATFLNFESLCKLLFMLP